MHNRRIVALDRRCPVIGFGAWGIGGETADGTSYGPIDEQAAAVCIETALNNGIRFFDTAPAYGNGESEKRLGRAIGGVREDIILATKGGQIQFDQNPDFSEASLEQSLNNSLKRLATDYIDLYQLHNPPASIFEREPRLANWLTRQVNSGAARSIGVSVKSPEEAFTLLKSYPFKTVQLNFNMLDVRALTSGLLDHCAKTGVSVIARTPLCFGFLTLKVNEDTTFDSADHRAHWKRDQLNLWSKGASAAQALVERHDAITASPTSRALRFCLAHPAVSCVLCGPMTAKEVKENAAAGLEPPLDNACLADIQSLNEKQDFFLRS
jgi:aryl-alcohol dehydrogenase-like predicted oxidoreductase